MHTPYRWNEKEDDKIFLFNKFPISLVIISYNHLYLIILYDEEHQRKSMIIPNCPGLWKELIRSEVSIWNPKNSILHILLTGNCKLRLIKKIASLIIPLKPNRKQHILIIHMISKDLKWAKTWKLCPIDGDWCFKATKKK